MAKPCPIDATHPELLEIAPDVFYCQTCDLSYTIKKGKVIIDAQSQDGKNRLDKLEQLVAEQETTIYNLVTQIWGNKKPDWFEKEFPGV